MNILGEWRWDNWRGDAWGGLAAMLVALPSAIAFGVTILSPLGHEYAAQGAVAGILGATAIGLVAAALGGAERLISAPCAPAAAVLSAFAIQVSQHGVAPQSVLLMLILMGLMCGLLQVLFGAIRIGRLIKYMPYPVVSGYLSGVGLIIILSQVPKFLGAPQGAPLWEVLRSPSAWQWQGILVGAITVGVMLAAPRLTKAVPAAILGLAAGVLSYFALGLADRSLLELAGNALVVGSLSVSDVGFTDAIVGRWQAFGGLGRKELVSVIIPALTLAVLLSIDTLKTCVVTDALTRTRHDSNRVLIGQGLGNLAAAAVGGVPGAGTMGATLVNMSSGGLTRLSGLTAGLLTLAAFLVLQNVIQWIPIAALAGILIVIGVRMFDLHSLQLLRQRSTMLDFMVIVAVIAVAETVSLIAASGVGIGLAILLFIREQIGGAVVRRKSMGNQTFSKQVRLPAEMAILEQRGDQTAIFELQGSLFFGTTDQLYTALEPDLKTRTYIILDLRRVQSVDVTAAHVLELIEDLLTERKAFLIFSQLPQNVASGRDMRQYFDEVGLVRKEHQVRAFGELDDALEWVENRILEEARLERAAEKPLELGEIELFRNRKAETLAALEACMDKRSFKRGEKIFARGESGDELLLIRRGSVRIMLPLDDKQSHHLATFGRGDFIGEMSFLDGAARSADAVAFSDTDLYALSRKRFDAMASEHKRLAINLFEGLARMLAIRLRFANSELLLLELS
ncbi:MAG: cyclic nucleotide-binding protein [Betaproteobacteria bacterium RBG_16_66_20]|nr:MAG: cyclic nucleotide-binding protein [Betaproteobacteria bacterium RBG_16_66_20]